MRALNILIAFTLIAYLIATSSCTKDTPPCCDCPVPYTETGRNIIGCKMDGRPWRICYKGEPIKTGTTVYRDKMGGRDYWHIRCPKKNKNLDEIFNIYLDKPKLSSGFWLNFEYFSNDSLWTPGVYNVDQSFPYHMELTKYDTINRIVSGRFECTLSTNWFGSKDTITVTEGVFDTHY